MDLESNEYVREARKRSLTGRIICGSRVGYEGNEEFTKGEVIRVLEEINRYISDLGYLPIPCIVSLGNLVGRSGAENYRELVFTLDFSWSPRSQSIERDVFYSTLIKYVNEIGKKMSQERVYLEFDGKTEVFKRAG